MGLIVFVRRDLVVSAVKQNFAQLLGRFEPYALRWNREEALRLVYWTAERAGIVSATLQPEWNEAELVQRLEPVWGRKLGQANSREARAADWVLAALSDLRGQVQARDLMRFLSEAARLAREDRQWEDRILPPQAVRRALEPCSRAKMEEAEEEIPELKELLDRLRGVSVEGLQVPFTPAQAHLTPGEVRLLETHGIVYRENDLLYLPEIFRQGLGLPAGARGRARVLALARRGQDAAR